jgi:uncharacterized membrane protein
METTNLTSPPARTFPKAAGILFGLGLGGFFDRCSIQLSYGTALEFQ